MKRSLIFRLLVVAGLVGIAFMFRNLPLAEWLQKINELNAAHPLAVALAYIVIVIVATVALAPGWISLMLAGLLFGLFPGLIYAAIGIVGGAFAAFLAGRMLARSWVEERIGDSLRLQALDEAVETQSFSIIVLTRFAIVLPFNLLNYTYGLTRVRPLTYVAATALGMLPAIALYVYLGTLADDVGQILSGEARPAESVYWIAGIAVVAIAAVVWIVHRAAARALNRKMGREAGEKSENMAG